MMIGVLSATEKVAETEAISNTNPRIDRDGDSILSKTLLRINAAREKRKQAWANLHLPPTRLTKGR